MRVATVTNNKHLEGLLYSPQSDHVGIAMEYNVEHSLAYQQNNGWECNMLLIFHFIYWILKINPNPITWIICRSGGMVDAHV